MLEDGLSYPMKGDSWIGRIVIGGVITFLAFLVFPAFIATGYFVRVLEATIEGEAEPPEWTDWGGLLVDGLKATVVGIAYSIVPTVVILGGGAMFLGLGAAAGESGGGVLAGIGLMSVLLLIPLFFIIYLVVPAALCNMAAEDSLGAAFDLDVLTDVVLTGDYIVAVLMPIVIGVLVNVVSFVLGITIIGYLLVPFVSFYGQVAIFRMFGLAFAEQASERVGTQTGATTVA